MANGFFMSTNVILNKIGMEIYKHCIKVKNVSLTQGGNYEDIAKWHIFIWANSNSYNMYCSYDV